MCVRAVRVQAAVYKWWGHAWSFHPRDDVTIMQAVVPVASGLSHMRYELPAYVAVEPVGWAPPPAPSDNVKNEL